MDLLQSQFGYGWMEPNSASGTHVWYSGLIRAKGKEDTWLGYHGQVLSWSGIMVSFLVQSIQDWLAEYESMTAPVLTPELWYGSCFYVFEAHDEIHYNPELNKAFPSN